MVLNPLSISLLVTASVACLFFAWYRRRDPSVIEGRIQQYIQQAVPLEQIELEQAFTDRMLRPLLSALLRLLGRVTPVGNSLRLKRDLVLAGNPGNLALIDFLGLKVLCAVITGAAVTTFLALRIPIASALLFGVAGALLGLYLPNFWLRRRIKTRQHELRKALPDALDMLTICVDAGLGFDAALLKVAGKWNNALGREFERVIGEIHMGVRRLDALRHLVERTDVPEIASFVAVLVQADRLGVPIADVLHAQSEQMRMRRRQWAEEQAKKAPIKMLIPIGVFIFPAMFAVILGPAVPRLLSAFGGG
jgi:tight adherence protein C